MAFTQSWIDELLAKNDIVSVVSGYVSLKPKGRRLWGLCPIHGEKTASFSVSPDKQMFYCFGCHAGGTAIQFIMQMERLTFPEAVRFLAERAGMTVPEDRDDEQYQQERARKERLYQACNLAARFYMENLIGANGGPAREYFARRNIGSSAVKRFGLGYAPEGWDNLKNHLTAQGFTEDELLDAGLLVRNPNSGRIYDAYRNRVIFPIIGVNGRVIGFGARVMNQEDKPKYINTGDTPIYNKRRNLYGLNLQKSTRLSSLIMVEGYTDVIGMYNAGIENVVASLGTALTEEQARLLTRYVSSVFIAYDGDAAGQNATLRGLDILQKEGLDVRVIVFPDNLDPDEYCRKYGKEGIDALIDAAISLNSFKLICLKRGFDLSKDHDREKYAMDACRMIARMEPVQQEACIAQVSKETGLSVASLEAQIGRDQKRETVSEQNARRRAGASSGRDALKDVNSARNIAEGMIVSCMARSAEAVKYVRENQILDSVRNTVYKDFGLKLAASEDPEKEIHSIVGTMEEGPASLISSLLNKDTQYGSPVQMIDDCVERIRKIERDELIDSLGRQLAAPGLSPENRKDILMRIQELNRQKNANN
ncbi:MAG: DNA primase [Clostridia bacterium]|nr:DNA primase [Clostridia bacterium]MBR0444697.1 DNA primase [Clostridia bacterium]